MIKENFTPAAKRLRRKLEIMRLDFKTSNNNRKYDIDECLNLLIIMEKSCEEALHSSVSSADDGAGDRPAQG